jgi:hypothetical protein
MQVMSGTLQAVDFTAKAWASGQIEIALWAAREYGKLGGLAESILAICRELREEEQAVEKRYPAMESIETIAVALSSICRHANDASLQFVALQNVGRHEWLRDIAPLGERITRSLRLCVVAFANREIAHARSAIRGIDDCRWIYSQAQKTQVFTQSGMTGSWYEQSIVTDLMRVMDSVHIVALQLNCAKVYDI